MKTRKDLIGRLELARRLDVDPRTIDRWTKDGLRGYRLNPVPIGARVYYRPADVDRWQALVAEARDLGLTLPLLAVTETKATKEAHSEADDARWQAAGLKW